MERFQQQSGQDPGWSQTYNCLLFGPMIVAPPSYPVIIFTTLTYMKKSLDMGTEKGSSMHGKAVCSNQASVFVPAHSVP